MKRQFLSILAISAIIPISAVNAGNYTSKEVTFNNDTIKLVGTLTVPNDVRKAPVAIILSGTGQQNRDGNMSGHRMFADIADYLGNRGIAVLRFDDRGTGDSTGDYGTSTTEDFAKDGLAAIECLKTRGDIDPSRIGFIGHSEGGAAMSIAASRSEDVKFMVSLAGLCMDGLNALIRQNEDLVCSYNLPDHDVKRYNVVNELMFRVAYKYADSDSLETKLQETYDKWHAVDSIYFSTLNQEFDHLRFPIYMYKMQASGPWYRFHIRYNPADYLKDVHIPVLALNGDKDKMVNSKTHLAGWKNNLPEGADLTTIELKGLNHLFLPCETGLPTEYASIQAPLSQEMLEIVANWITEKTKYAK